MLPLGERVRHKVMAIIREEMDAIGGQEVLPSAAASEEDRDRTGRIDTMADIIMTFDDNKGAAVVLGPTHEEIFATVSTELESYKQLPQLWYHIQTKFRDEPRPKSGLLRVREFTMKDSYSFDIDLDGLDIQFDRHVTAYSRIFERLGLDVVAVRASSGAMGGGESIEFMVASEVGETSWLTAERADTRPTSRRRRRASVRVTMPKAITPSSVSRRRASGPSPISQRSLAEPRQTDRSRPSCTSSMVNPPWC